LKAPYLNVTIPLTQTGGFDSVVQAIKASGANGLFVGLGTAANLGMMAAVQQAGLKFKAIVLIPTVPYAAISGAQVISELQNTWTPWPMTPTITNTAQAKVITQALAKYEHQTTPADQSELSGWAAADGMIQGLKLAGPNPTRAKFLSRIKGMKSYNGGGVAIQPVNESVAAAAASTNTSAYPGVCDYMTQFLGSRKYVLNGRPICGGLVPNSNAS
jgi:ABC-type branched-subunit amino acid transport system substrate-binding protein